VMLLDQCIAGLGLFQVALTRLPEGEFPRLTREDGLHREHEPLGPLALLLSRHACLLHRLHQPMHAELAFSSHPLDQRKGQQGGEHLVETPPIRHRLVQSGRPIRRALGEELFGDVVRCHKRA